MTYSLQTIRTPIALVAALALVVPALAATPQRRASAAEAPDAAAAKKIIRGAVLDPTSVQFEVEKAKKVTGPDGVEVSVTCGTYNAKNRMGGYVGRSFFVYVPAQRAVFTSNIDRLNADGSGESLSSMTQSIRRGVSAARMAEIDARAQVLQKDVKEWLARCG